MTSFRIRAASALLMVAATTAGAPAMAAPIGQPLAAKPATVLTEQVYWRRGWGWGPGAFVGGLAAGAIIGGAIAAPYGPGPYYYGPAYAPPPGYAPPPEGDLEYCMQRYKSYDPNTGTFLGKDGRRHPCP
jgi:hypothetical protein